MSESTTTAAEPLRSAAVTVIATAAASPATSSRHTSNEPTTSGRGRRGVAREPVRDGSASIVVRSRCRTASARAGASSLGLGEVDHEEITGSSSGPRVRSSDHRTEETWMPSSSAICASDSPPNAWSSRISRCRPLHVDDPVQDVPHRGLAVLRRRPLRRDEPAASRHARRGQVQEQRQRAFVAGRQLAPATPRLQERLAPAAPRRPPATRSAGSSRGGPPGGAGRRASRTRARRLDPLTTRGLDRCARPHQSDRHGRAPF